MDLTANARVVLERRYLAKDTHGNITESPEDMCRRVARAVAGSDEALAARFFARMDALEFLPNSPALMNAGRTLGQLSACFVVPVKDATDSLFQAIGWAAEIQKTGGGTGFSFSSLRPAGDRVESTGGRASGPVSFMQIFDAATDAIKQGGTRRGANMGILRVDHPDILDFIATKLDPNRMRNFNLSVAVTDAFMEALQSGGTYELRNPRSGQVTRKLAAARVFELMQNAAWATGDPGVVFIDRMNAASPTPDLGQIEATNPCGEQPLLPFESCTLGSINLLPFVAGPDFDWPKLKAVIRDAVDFLDRVIDANRYPFAEIQTATKRTRKIGLGVMGFADALIALGIPYDAPEAVAVADKVAAFLESESIGRSRELAAELGPFPAFHGSRWQRGEWGDARPLRNATTTTVAPTGTIALIAGCSSGIEPLYAVAYERRALDGEILSELHPGFQKLAKARGFASDALFAEVKKRGHVRGLAGVPEDVQRLFPTAHEIPLEVHLRMQAAFQKYVHAAVSKTINLPRTATPEDVGRAYRMAFELGCKGVTVFRDGSRDEQVLSVSAATPERPAGPVCPQCQSALVAYERCQVCRNCGWSACS